VPGEYIREGSIEDRKPVVDRSLPSCERFIPHEW
jgi:hypothetical protein